MIIPKEKWHICAICNKKINSLAKIYGGKNIYFTHVFEQHLILEHNINILDYFIKYDNQPKCLCNMCDKPSIIIKKGSNFIWKDYICGRYPGTMQWSQNAKYTRLGRNNPMYNKKAWNNGLTKANSTSLMTISKKMTNRIVSNKTKIKQSEAAKKRLIHGHTGHFHTIETKQKLQNCTLKRIQNHEFPQTKTKPHIIFCKILQELNIDYIEEYIIDIWSFDIYLTKYKILIEIDGDYFHANPNTRWPNGPITNTQKINVYRDKKKNLFCINNNLTLYRFWEDDILNHKDKVICRLKKLLISKE